MEVSNEHPEEGDYGGGGGDDEVGTSTAPTALPRPTTLNGGWLLT